MSWWVPVITTAAGIFAPPLAPAVGIAAGAIDRKIQSNKARSAAAQDAANAAAGGFPGAQGGLIFESGSPYWPGSQPRFPSSLQNTGGGGGGGGSSSESTSHSISNTTYDNLTVPYILPGYKPLEGSIFNAVSDRVNQPYSLPRGYQASGIAGINEAFDLTGQSLQNRLVGSGLTGGMEAGALGGFEAQRAKALSGFTNELPMIEREQRTQDLQLASAILESFGRGQKSSGSQRTETSSRSTGTSSGGGGGAGVQIPQLGDAIMQQYLSGQQGKSSGSWLDKALGYAALVAGIYASIKGGR